MIHGVDSIKLLKTINKEAKKNQRIIKCLFQVYIASEDTKFGLTVEDPDEPGLLTEVTEIDVAPPETDQLRLALSVPLLIIEFFKKKSSI